MVDVLHRADDVVRRVRLAGELEARSADEVVDYLGRVQVAMTIVDISGLTFIDSAGILALVTTKRRIQARGGQLKLRGTPKHIRRVFEICGAGQLLED